MAGPVKIAILGNSSSAVNALRKTSGEARTLGSRLGSLTKAAAKYAAVGIGAVVVAGAKLADMAAEDQRSAALLANSLKNTTGATNDQVSAVEDWITAQGKALGIADDQLRPALEKLATATGSVGKAQEQASLAMDVAAGRGKDLNTVVEALAKAQNGNLGGLQRLGVETKNAAGETKSLAEITDDLAKKYKGSAATAANTAAGKFERVKLALSETAESIGTELLPIATSLGDWLVDTGVPAMEDLAQAGKAKLGPVIQDLTGWFSDNKKELSDLAGTVVDTAIPALKTAGEIVGNAVKFFAGLPGPVKQFGVEVGIAALIIPRLTGALGGLKLAELTSGLGGAEGRMRALGQTARTVAGVAGMAALIDSTKQTNDAISTLEKTLGGAALGGAVGGPWGALFGGTIGALHSAFEIMFSDVEQAGVVLTDGKAPVQDYASTFDQLTGAITGSTKAAIINAAQRAGVLGQLRTFGITQRQLVNATLGNKGAIEAVNGALQASRGLTIAYTDAWGRQYTMSVRTERQAKKLSDELIAQGNTIDEVRASQLDLAASDAILDFIGKQSREWKAASKTVRAQILASQDLEAVYKAFPKKVATAIDATGVVPTAKGVADLAVKYDAVDKRHIKALIQATGTDLSVRQVQDVIDKMKQLHDKTVTVTVKTEAVGAPGGMGGHAASRGTVDPLQALIAGFAQGSDGVRSAMEKLLSYIDKGFSDRLKKIKKELDKTLDGKALDEAVKKASEKLDKQQKRLMKRTAQIRKDLRAQGKLIDDNAEALDNARSALQALKDTAAGYADQIKQSFEQFGSVIGLGGDTGFADANQLIELLRKKVEQAKQYGALIKALMAAGLNQTAIQQLIDAGVEGGLGTAQAILEGGPAAISEINALQAELSAQGASLGSAAASSLYDAGIAAAQGLVDGLAANADALAKQAKKLARALVKAVKKALGIESPSKVFKDLGKQTVRGLAIGLDDVYVKRQGTSLAHSLQKGFGTPALDAFAEVTARASSKQQVEVKLTAEQVDQLSRGRAMSLDIDIYKTNGGRVRA